MIQRDYILRLVEQLAKILSKVLLNRQEGKPREALEEIENSFGKIIGIDSLVLEALPAEKAAEMLGVSTESPAGGVKCLVAGRLLKEKADILVMDHDGRAMGCYQKALGLYLQGIRNIGAEEMDLKEYYADVKEIEKVLSQLS